MKMKDKKAEQIAAKKKHREQLKKCRRSEQNLERPVPKLIEKPTILIVCEGENTEPSYFSQFRLSSAIIKPIGEGFNTISLVERTKVLSKDKNFEQVWCVFDKDDFEINDFNNAIALAESNNFKVAYSNQAFEYWILLHFNDHQGGGMHRNDYNKKINSHLKEFAVTYDGDASKIITEEIFELLEGNDEKTKKIRRTLAIERAKKIYNKLDHSNPANEESSTTVYKLVEEIIKYI